MSINALKIWQLVFIAFLVSLVGGLVTVSFTLHNDIKSIPAINWIISVGLLWLTGILIKSFLALHDLRKDRSIKK
ncbi:hypothetical protein A3715_10530 [Oleiphilus sp. HI0009]|nr:hypothetical protein A3715_22660 [Oleiphilus sp. HI0009]KZX78295.1 hypothetical protein A3715_10530 [Oleiphilus sp. HI0009]